MKTKLFFLFLFVGIFTFSQQQLSPPERFYSDVLDFVVKQRNLNSVGTGLEKVGFEKKSTSISDDGEYMTSEYGLPEDGKLLIIRSMSDGFVNKIYLIHKLSLSYFIMDYLTDIASTYKPNQIWYNRSKTMIFTYEMKENTVGIVQILDI